MSGERQIVHGTDGDAFAAFYTGFGMDFQLVAVMLRFAGEPEPLSEQTEQMGKDT